MHNERIAVFAAGLTGAVGCFLPWTGGNQTGNTITGADFWWGWICILFFALILLIVAVGKLPEPIEKGNMRIAILILSGLAFLSTLGLVVLLAIFPWGAAQYGLYISLVASTACMVFPFVIKDSGKITAPDFNDLSRDLQKNEQALEDKVNDFGDKPKEK